AANPAFVAVNLRVPARVDDSTYAAGVIDHHRRVVFDRIVMHGVRQMYGSAQRLAEEKIQNIDEMGGDVVYWAAARGLGGEQPFAIAFFRSFLIEPGMRGQLSVKWFADRSRCNQFLCAMHLGISTSIVGDAERFAALLCSVHHAEGLGVAHGHGLFAKY